jgi:predicted metal-dependent phosphoesterase TrpH
VRLPAWPIISGKPHGGFNRRGITATHKRNRSVNLQNRIQFEKPDLTALTQTATVVDMHFHTRYSDGLNSVAAVAQRAQELGIGIAITDHNTIQGAVEISRYWNLLTIPGIEITSREGTHVLAYFYDIKSLKRFYARDVQPYMGPEVMSAISLSMEEIIQRARVFNAVIIFPHPYCAVYTGICNLQFPPERRQHLLDLVDGVEVINSENLNKWNLRCALLGFNLNKAITGGSDGHTLYHMGRVVSYTPGRKNRKTFLDAVRSGENNVVGKEIDLLRKMTSNGLKFKTTFRNCPDLLERNFKYSCMAINSRSKRLRASVLRSLNEKIRKRREKIAPYPAH